MEKQSSIFIKGMVCNRCVMTVTSELEKLGYAPLKVNLGEAIFAENGKAINRTELQNVLSPLGFSLLEDKKLTIANEVKALVAEVYKGDYDFPENFRFSTLVKERLNKDYNVVSEAFIVTEKKTIEQYIIEHRINVIKELLVYTDLTLADIAFKLNFSSAAYLAAQFKQHTGLTTSYFRNLRL